MATIPRTGIQEVIVRNTLNANGANTDDQWSNLCGAAGKANWRARYKPVPYNVNFCQDHSPSGANYLAGWWKAFIPGDSYKSGRCGVNFPTYTSTASLQGVTDPSTLWGHDYPTGGSAQPYRITDFAGYDPKARDIIEVIRATPDGTVNKANAGYSSMLLAIFRNNLETSALDYTEIGYRAQYQLWLKNLYLGVVVIRNSGTYHGVGSMPYTMAELESVDEDEYYAMDDHYAGMTLKGDMFQMLGAYTLYPVLFEQEQSARSATSAISCGNYIPLPVAPLAIEVVDVTNFVSAIPISVTKASSSDQWGTALNVTVRVENTNPSVSYTFDGSNNYIEAGLARSYNFVEGGGAYTYARYATSFEVAPNSTKDIVITTPYNSSIPASDGEALVGVRMRFMEEITPREGFPFKF
ncbi:MAG: hypothetical protein IKM12_00220 [Alistipes sp.]|nr:hypothetical protein [Alistipes sp.]